MQTKPNASTVIFICKDGYTSDDSSLFGLSQKANDYDINGDNIKFSPSQWIKKVTFPAIKSPVTLSHINDIIKFIGKKYEIFDINVTDEISVFNSKPKKNRYLCMLVEKPSGVELQSLINNRSENATLPYSFRRWLLGSPTSMIVNDVFLNNKLWQGLAFTDVNGFAANAVSQSLVSITQEDKFCVVFTNKSPTILDWRRVEWFPHPDTTDNEWKYVALVATHELGHIFGLWHDTRGGSPYDNDEDSYYKGHGVWSPIMGWTRGGNILQQWAKNDYSLNTNLEDDILIISKQSGFIKPPSKSKDLIEESLKFFENNSDYCWDDKGYNIRTISNKDLVSNKYIEGMIGFPYDFDLLKFVLPRGTYNFTVDSDSVNNPGSVLDIQVDYINCHCEKSEEKMPVKCDQDKLPGIYPSNITYQCRPYDPCLSSSYLRSREFGMDDGFKNVTASITIEYTSIIYLRIRGGKDKTPNDGWSRYGSVGKYRLDITKDGAVPNFGTEDLPVCNCEEYTYCDGGSDKTVILYTQEENEDKGTQNQAGAHIKEYTILNNGESKTGKFLVYGAPLNISTDCAKEGKFCIDVYDSQLNRCVRQEFVVGGEWEKKKEIQ
jgi:hypothetical protein